MAVCQMVPLKKRGTGDVRSPFNLGGRPNTYVMYFLHEDILNVAIVLLERYLNKL